MLAIEPRLALDIDFAHIPGANIINYREKDWYWLNIHRQYCSAHPEDFISKKIYQNYLRWYKNNDR